MNSEKDRLNMFSDLDNGTWDTLAALSDWHEEAGESATAAGYRWLRDNKRHPRLMSGLSWRWVYMRHYMSQVFRRYWNDPAFLPLRERQGMTADSPPPGMQRTYMSRAKAYAQAAELIGALALVGAKELKRDP